MMNNKCNKMMAILGAIVIQVVANDLPKTPAEPSQDVRPSWAGKTYRADETIAPNLKFLEGGVYADGNWSLSHWGAGEVEFVVLSTSEGVKTRMADAIQLNLSRKNTFLFTSECKQKRNDVVVAAVASKIGLKFPKIFQAWLPDTLAGKLVPIDPKTVKCHSDEDIAE